MSERITQLQALTIADAFLSFGEVFEMMADFDEARIERILKDPLMANTMNTPEAKRLLRFGARREIKQFRKIAKRAKKMAGKWEKVTGGHWPMGLKEKRRQQLTHCESMLRDKFMTTNDSTYTTAEKVQLEGARQAALGDVNKAIVTLES